MTAHPSEPAASNTSSACMSDPRAAPHCRCRRAARPAARRVRARSKRRPRRPYSAAATARRSNASSSGPRDSARRASHRVALARPQGCAWASERARSRSVTAVAASRRPSSSRPSTRSGATGKTPGSSTPSRAVCAQTVARSSNSPGRIVAEERRDAARPQPLEVISSAGPGPTWPRSREWRAPRPRRSCRAPRRGPPDTVRTPAGPSMRAPATRRTRRAVALRYPSYRPAARAPPAGTGATRPTTFRLALPRARGGARTRAVPPRSRLGLRAGRQRSARRSGTGERRRESCLRTVRPDPRIQLPRSSRANASAKRTFRLSRAPAVASDGEDAGGCVIGFPDPLDAAAGQVPGTTAPWRGHAAAGHAGWPPARLPCAGPTRRCARH